MNAAIRAAILEADPSLAPVLNAIDEAAKNAPAGSRRGSADTAAHCAR